MRVLNLGEPHDDLRSTARTAEISWLAVADLWATCRPVAQMVKQATTAAARDRRMRAVWYQKDHPKTYFRRIAKKTGWTRPYVRRWVRRYEQSTDAGDHPRSGRPLIAGETAQQHVLEVALLSKRVFMLL